MARVSAHSKRRCPHCGSSHWVWLGAVPTTPEELEKYLLTRYRCQNCGQEFLAEEAKRVRLATETSRCIHCASKKIQRTSKPGADLEIYQCQQCHGYMARKPDSSDPG